MKDIHAVLDTYSIYHEVCGGSNAIESKMLADQAGVTELVEKLVEAGLTKEQILGAVKATGKKESRGRKPDEIDNPSFELFQSYVLGELSEVDAANVDDAIVGVCRSFVDDENQKRTGLSPSKLKKIMTFSSFTNKSIASLLGVGDRQARRYMQGARLLSSLVSKGVNCTK